MKNLLLVKPKFNRYLFAKETSKIKHSTSLDLAYKSGIYTKENYYAIKSNDEIKKLQIPELKNLINESKQKINQIFKISDFNFREGSIFLFCSYTKNLTNKFLKELKKLKTELDIYRTELAQKQNQTYTLPYTEGIKVDTSKEIKPFLYNDDDIFLKHPREKVKKIIGENTQGDVLKIEKYCNYYSKSTCYDLLKEKFHILKFISKHSNSDEYTNNEILLLTNYANRYDAINYLLENEGINTRSIEQLLFFGIKNSFNSGDLLPNGEYVLSSTKTYDKQLKRNIKSIITYCNTDIGQRFRLYNIDLIPKIEAYIKHFMTSAKKGNLSQINLMNKSIEKYLKNIKIAEVYLECLEKNDMVAKMHNSDLFTDEMITDLTNDQEKFFYIKNLINFNEKKYYNVAITLIKSLKDFGKANGIPKAYLESMAYNNTKTSPTFMYMRCGCKPVSKNKEKIFKAFNDVLKLDYTEPVWLECVI